MARNSEDVFMKVLDSNSVEKPEFKSLVSALITWINDELADERIVVSNLGEDLYDGQVLQTLMDKLLLEESHKLKHFPEVIADSEKQQMKLKMILDCINEILQVKDPFKCNWSVESIHSKNLLSIIQLLIAISHHFNAKLVLPHSVSVDVYYEGFHETIELIDQNVRRSLKSESDGIETLFESQDKIETVKKALLNFVNMNLEKLHFTVESLTDFEDGVHLIILLGMVGKFFVPLHSYYTTPQDSKEKIHNVKKAFELMQEIGLDTTNCIAEDIVRKDEKSIVRVLYRVFSKFKSERNVL